MQMSVSKMRSHVVAGHAVHGTSQGSGAALQPLDMRQPMEIDHVRLTIVIPPLTGWGD